jgi:hypothetical protein
MQELQAENSRLHRLLDIFDCQPDYAFCATSDGTVTFVNDRLACLNFYTGNGGAYPNNNVHDDDDPHGMKAKSGNISHISEILDQRSVGALMDMISSLSRNGSSGNNKMDASTTQFSKLHNSHTDVLPSEPIEVYLNQTEPSLDEGLTCGYLRVSRVLRKPSHLVDDASISVSNSPRSSNQHNTIDSKAPALKKIKIGDDKNTFISAQSLEDAAAVLSALTGLATGTPGMQQETALKALEENVKEEGYSNSKNSSASNSSNNIAGQNRPQDGTTVGESKVRRPQRNTSATSTINDYVTSTQKSTKANGNSGNAIDNDSASNISTEASIDEEYICVIRPLKYTFPFELETKRYPVHLSKASMSAHNAEIVKRDSQNIGTRKRSCSGSSETEYDNSSSSASSSGDVSGDSSASGNTTIATRMSIDDDSGSNS